METYFNKIVNCYFTRKLYYVDGAFTFFNALQSSMKNVFDVLRDLVPFVQFKKREKNHGGVLLLVKFHVCFSRFSNCKNVTKPRKTFQFAFNFLHKIMHRIQ